MTHYNGKLCERHPDKFGVRYIKGDRCVFCYRESKAPKKQSNVMCERCGTLPRYNRRRVCKDCLNEYNKWSRIATTPADELRQARRDAHKKLETEYYQDVNMVQF